MNDATANPTNPATETPIDPQHRPVLVWHPGRDEPHVKADVAEAATFLKASVADILTAIDGGELLDGWFVDWAAPSQWRTKES